MDNLPLDEPQVDEIDKSDHSPKKKQYETIIEEAHEMYANIIEEANKEAKRIMEEKYNEIEIFKKKELEKAYEQGFRKGYMKLEKTEKIIDEAINIRQNLEKERKAYIKMQKKI